MPVRVDSRRFVKFRYEPDYLKNRESLITDPAVCCSVPGLQRPSISRIKLDGGNVVGAGNIAILTDKVFDENPRSSRDDLVRELERKLKSLTMLDLDLTNVTDAGLKEIAELKNLTMLDLATTKVTDEGLKEIAKLNNLRFLRLDDTVVTDAGLKKLQEALPRCRLQLVRRFQVERPARSSF